MSDQAAENAVNTPASPAFPNTYPTLTKALDRKGYAVPTKVQGEILNPAFEGRDLLVSAQTGSGKTVAFGLAFARDLLDAQGRIAPAGGPLTLVVAPTRELAEQVKKELEWLYADTGAKIAFCIGGTDARREARVLASGAQIVVGTPGRLCDHLRRSALNLSQVRVAVLDEADEMLDMGFREELEALLNALPADHRTLLFSATLAREIVALAKKFQKDAVRIDVVSGQKQHADITYKGVLTASGELEPALVNVLRYYSAPTAMVFCNTRAMVNELQTYLLARGFRSVAISGEMGQSERGRAIASLKSGQAQVCVATDVAARGLDIPALALVIHASLPTSAETLLHRSGRTGRAGRKGTSVVMAPVTQRRRADRLLQQAKINASWESAPTAAMILEQDGRHLLENACFAQLSEEENVPAEKELIGKLTQEYTPQQLATALVGFYSSTLPQAEAVRTLDPNAPQPKGQQDRGRRPPFRGGRRDFGRGGFGGGRGFPRSPGPYRKGGPAKSRGSER